MWTTDLRRSVDYLETRDDIDMGRLAYVGFSWGARMAPMMLALEDRFVTGVLALGGFKQQRILPEADPFHFAPRVRVPVLMVNGRYDFLFPIDTSQRPMFELFGTRPEDKKWAVYDDGHMVPKAPLAQEFLGWLDTYLGPVE